jgi:hypothetical protein
MSLGYAQALFFSILSSRIVVSTLASVRNAGSIPAGETRMVAN